MQLFCRLYFVNLLWNSSILIINQQYLSIKKIFRQECVFYELNSSVLLSKILQRSVWRFVAIQMQERCLNESAWKNCHTSTEPSVSPWILKAEILECFSQIPKQSRSSSFMMSKSVYMGSCLHTVFTDVKRTYADYTLKNRRMELI